MQEKLLAMAVAGNPVLEKNKAGITLEELSEQKLIFPIDTGVICCPRSKRRGFFV